MQSELNTYEQFKNRLGSAVGVDPNRVGNTHCRALSEEHRGSATENEARAAEYIKKVFDSCGLETYVDSFRTQKTFSTLYIILYSLTILSVVLVPYFPEDSLFICVISLVLYLFETDTHGVLSKLLRSGKSQNVLAKMKSESNAKRKMVICAHYDSSKSSLAFHPKFVKSFRGSFLAVTYSMFAVPIIYFVGFLLNYHPQYWSSLKGAIWYSSFPFAACIVFALVILIHREISGKYVKGASDNASGVSAMLDVAEKLSKNPPKSTEVLFLATGAEEVGLVGMTHFLDRYKKELPKKETYIINIDNVGSGEIKYITEEGMTGRFSASGELLAMAEDAAKNMNIRPQSYRTMPTDATAALARGYKAMSVMAFADGALPNWHWITDTYENVSEENIKKASEFILSIIRGIDEETTGLHKINTDRKDNK
jgi:hypothetical protein